MHRLGYYLSQITSALNKLMYHGYIWSMNFYVIFYAILTTVEEALLKVKLWKSKLELFLKICSHFQMVYKSAKHNFLKAILFYPYFLIYNTFPDEVVKATYNLKLKRKNRKMPITCATNSLFNSREVTNYFYSQGNLISPRLTHCNQVQIATIMNRIWSFMLHAKT